MILLDLLVRACGWLIGLAAVAAVLNGQELAAGFFVFTAVTLVSVGRDMRYRRLARQLDRWAAEDIEVEGHRRIR